ncbi:hypothetical protein FBU30_009704 [Linnemannia zychae]|nr:hypothetical protein FBU30_009704 [Linnemannia zychae]
MDKGGITYSRNGRLDYDDRHADAGGYHGYGHGDSSGGYRRNPGSGYSNSGRIPPAAGWGQYSNSNSGRSRTDTSQYPSDRQSGNSFQGSPPKAHGYDGPGTGRGEDRGSFGDNSYRGHMNSNYYGPPGPSESLKAYQQSKSSDPYAVGLKSSAAFFHEAYDKLERPGGFADSTAGTQYTVTVIKTYREMATQTTDDQVPGAQDSTWNGVRIITTGKPQQQQQRPNQANPTRSTAAVTSLLNAVLTPAQSPAVSSAIVNKPTSGPFGHSPEERRLYGMTGYGSGAGGVKTTEKPLPTTGSTAIKSSTTISDNTAWMVGSDSESRKNTTITEASKKVDMTEAPSTSSTKADPWLQPAVSTTPKTADPWLQPAVSTTPKTTDSWSQPAVSTSTKAADPWSQPAVSATTKAADSWGQPAGGTTTDTSGKNTWDNSNQGKAVSDFVDWSTGQVSEFPAEAKPTFMTVTEPWDKMSKYDSKYISRRDANAQQTSQQREFQSQQQTSQQQRTQQQNQQQSQQQSQQRQQQQSSPQQQRQSQLNTSDPEDEATERRQYREREQSQEKKITALEQGVTDPWLNDGNATLQGWASSEPEDSQMDYMDRVDTRNQGYHSSRTNEQRPHRMPSSRHYDDDNGHYSGSSPSQERRILTSEERFYNSYNRVPSGNMTGGPGSGGINHRHGNKGSGNSGATGGGLGGNSYNLPQRYGAMTSSQGAPLGRRPPNSKVDQSSAIGAWSAASQNAAKISPGQGSSPSSTSASQHSSSGTPSAKFGGGGGRLATASDFGSFFQATAAFTPPVMKTRHNDRPQDGDENEIMSTQLSTPIMSRESSRSRPSYSGDGLEHTEEESLGAEEADSHGSFTPRQDQINEAEEDLIKDEDVNLPISNPNINKVMDSIAEDDKGDQQKEGESKPPTERTNSSSSRSSSQAMEDNLLDFENSKHKFSISSSGREGKEEQKEKEKEEEGKEEEGQEKKTDKDGEEDKDKVDNRKEEGEEVGEAEKTEEPSSPSKGSPETDSGH